MAVYAPDKLKISKNGDTYQFDISKSITQYTSINQFPSTGDEHKLYIAKDTNSIYRWDTSNNIYISIGMLPPVTSADNGKVLTVVNGVWTAVAAN